MNIRPHKGEDVSLDITPLIDVVFLLLIFFMVSTTFDHSSEINITLPEASEEMLKSKPNSIWIAVNAQGDVYVNKKAVSDRRVKTIQDALSLAAVGMNQPSVIISGDTDASHQSVIRVMDAARNAGLVKITFAVKRTPGEG